MVLLVHRQVVKITSVGIVCTLLRGLDSECWYNVYFEERSQISVFELVVLC